MERVQVRVRVLGRVWIQRVAANHCPKCGWTTLTKAGREKVNRGGTAAQEVMGPSEEPWTPVIEIER